MLDRYVDFLTAILLTVLVIAVGVGCGIILYNLWTHVGVL